MKKGSKIAFCLVFLLVIVSTMARISRASDLSEPTITHVLSEKLSDYEPDTLIPIVVFYDASKVMPDIDFEEFRKHYGSNSEALQAYYTKGFSLIEPIVSPYMTLYKSDVVKTHGGPFFTGTATAEGCKMLMQLPEIVLVDEQGETEPAIVYLSIHGDVDLNGTINADDARLALRSAAKLEKLDPYAFLAADLNGDGRVTADEARKILRVAAELDSFD